MVVNPAPYFGSTGVSELYINKGLHWGRWSVITFGGCRREGAHSIRHQIENVCTGAPQLSEPWWNKQTNLEHTNFPLSINFLLNKYLNYKKLKPNLKLWLHKLVLRCWRCGRGLSADGAHAVLHNQRRADVFNEQRHAQHNQRHPHQGGRSKQQNFELLQWFTLAEGEYRSKITQFFYKPGM